MGVEHLTETDQQNFSPVEIDLTGQIPVCSDWHTAMDDAGNKFTRENVLRTEGACAKCKHRILTMSRDGNVTVSAPRECAKEVLKRRHGIPALLFGKWKAVKPKRRRQIFTNSNGKQT